MVPKLKIASAKKGEGDVARNLFEERKLSSDTLVLHKSNSDSSIVSSSLATTER